MTDNKIELTGDFNKKSGSSYLRLPLHPGRGTVGCVKRSVRLCDAIEYNHKELEISLDFDEDDRLIGIEILRYDK